jgi:hypothetical protein
MAYRNQFCQAKIQDLGMPSFGHKNVRWLDITVDDSLRVCRIQSVGNSNRNAEQLLHFQRTPSDGVI